MDQLSQSLAKLPDGWTHLKGLFYPTTINVDGETIEVKNYEEHHQIIKSIINK